MYSNTNNLCCPLQKKKKFSLFPWLYLVSLWLYCVQFFIAESKEWISPHVWILADNAKQKLLASSRICLFVCSLCSFYLFVKDNICCTEITWLSDLVFTYKSHQQVLTWCKSSVALWKLPMIVCQKIYPMNVYHIKCRVKYPFSCYEACRVYGKLKTI